MIAHLFITHLLYGAFFGAAGMLGSVAPDACGIVGWVRKTSAGSSLNWWAWMTDGARWWYRCMHSMPFALFVVSLELMVGQIFATPSFPWFAAGYFTHVVTDLFTHRQRLGGVVMMREIGPVVGIDWFTSRLYWTEWAGAALCVCVALLGYRNIIIDLVIR